MSLPDAVKTELRAKLWGIADELRWEHLSAAEKASFYEQWTRDPTIGGVLSRFMDARRVRVYLKDTLLKSYTREKLDDWSRMARILQVPADAVAQSYIKPNGRRLRDGRIICWAQAHSWRDVLMALHERAFVSRGTPHAAVFFQSVARFREPRVRTMVQLAATSLNIEKVIWLE